MQNWYRCSGTRCGWFSKTFHRGVTEAVANTYTGGHLAFFAGDQISNVLSFARDSRLYPVVLHDDCPRNYVHLDGGLPEFDLVTVGGAKYLDYRGRGAVVEASGDLAVSWQCLI